MLLVVQEVSSSMSEHLVFVPISFYTYKSASAYRVVLYYVCRTRSFPSEPDSLDIPVKRLSRKIPFWYLLAFPNTTDSSDWRMKIRAQKLGCGRTDALKCTIRVNERNDLLPQGRAERASFRVLPQHVGVLFFVVTPLEKNLTT